MKRVWTVASAVCALLAPAAAAGGPTWQSGDQKLSLALATRFRDECWDARARNWDCFTALRTRASLRYEMGERLSAFVELQDARIHGLGSDASGAGAVYRSAARSRSHAHGDRARQFWLELEATPGFRVRIGRQDLRLGSEVSYPEPDWRYLKSARLSQRLVGTVGWTHAERSSDGIRLSYDGERYHIDGFAARPTTGVFDLDSSYSQQDEIALAGISLTAKRGAWLRDGELRLFTLYYDDERDPDVTIYTAGFSLLTVRPCGPGRLDSLLWGATQWGKFPDPGDPTRELSHGAFAALFELGFRWENARWEPWLRAGINLASGDRSPSDSDHGTFFNLLPTNHLYYGFADQLAFANLIDSFLQLRLAATSRIHANLFLHRFQLESSREARIFGTGAFNREGFGYGRQSSSGHRGVGSELDLVVDVKLDDRVSLQVGYAYLWGHAVFNDLTDDDTRFAYLQLSASF